MASRAVWIMSNLNQTMPSMDRVIQMQSRG
jgi:hypothetical protein